MIELLLWITILSGLLQIFYWVYCCCNLTITKRHSNHIIAKEVPVSIIICAYNDSDNLIKNLHFFLEQVNIQSEVIVVNDHSTDHTLKVLDSLQLTFPYLKIVSLDGPSLPGKKAALTAGIKAAQFDYILLSDADCRPVSKSWAFKMSRYFDQQHEMVAGYSPFVKENSFVNAFARFENMITAMQYIGWGTGNMPYMAVGRNMGYTTSLIKKIGYFQSHSDLMAGDDDLTVQAAIKHSKVRYVLDNETFVMTESAKTWKQYFRQKMRHFSVSPRYGLINKVVLGVFVLSWAAFYLSLIIICVSGVQWMPAVFLLVRYCLVITCFLIMRKYLKQKIGLAYILIFDVCFPFIMGILAIFAALKSKPTWK